MCLWGLIITYLTFPEKFDSSIHLLYSGNHSQNHFFFCKWFEEQRKMLKTQKNTFSLKISIGNITQQPNISKCSFVCLIMYFLRLRLFNLKDYLVDFALRCSHQSVNLNQLSFIFVLLSTQKVYSWNNFHTNLPNVSNSRTNSLYHQFAFLRWFKSVQPKIKHET